MYYGPLIRKLREGRNLTITDVACSLHISTAYLSDVERGERGPFAYERSKFLAEVLGADLAPIALAALMDREPEYLAMLDMRTALMRIALAKSLGEAKAIAKSACSDG